MDLRTLAPYAAAIVAAALYEAARAAARRIMRSKPVKTPEIELTDGTRFHWTLDLDLFVRVVDLKSPDSCRVVHHSRDHNDRREFHQDLPFSYPVVVAAVERALRQAGDVFIRFPNDEANFLLPLSHFVRLGPSDPNSSSLRGWTTVVSRAPHSHQEFVHSLRCFEDQAKLAIGRAVHEREGVASSPVHPQRFIDLGGSTLFVRPEMVSAVNSHGNDVCFIYGPGFPGGFRVDLPAADVLADIERALAD